jgi:hypothetical protein
VAVLFGNGVNCTTFEISSVEAVRFTNFILEEMGIVLWFSNIEGNVLESGVSSPGEGTEDVFSFSDKE